MHLTNREARRFFLAYQNLWPPHALRGKEGALAHIRRVNCIQFDPLNKAGTSPELTLQARVRNFQPQMLYELLYEDRRLLDGLDKVMSIYPVEDFPYFRRRYEAARAHFGHDNRPAVAILPEVRKELEARGPLSSIDLDFHESVDWSWAPTRISRAALESMYLWGELVIHHKVHTRKVYDFAHRHLAADLLEAPEPNPTEEEFHDWYMLRRLGSFGIIWHLAGEAWLGMIDMKTPQRTASLKRLMARGEVHEVTVEGLSRPCYIRAQDIALLEETMASGPRRPRAAILAPLDNLLWDRRFVEELFGFSYKWEVYTPVRERQFGYYVLPVLYGDRFVARFEPVRDRKRSVLTIENWWWEENARPSTQMKTELGRTIRRFMRFLDVQSLEVNESVRVQPDVAWLGEI
ncbi:MAG: winged helix-turn-helix domain-containing protein [Caldilineaceae bacterium]